MSERHKDEIEAEVDMLRADLQNLRDELAVTRVEKIALAIGNDAKLAEIKRLQNKLALYRTGHPHD